MFLQFSFNIEFAPNGKLFSQMCCAYDGFTGVRKLPTSTKLVHAYHNCTKIANQILVIFSSTLLMVCRIARPLVNLSRWAIFPGIYNIAYTRVLGMFNYTHCRHIPRNALVNVFVDIFDEIFCRTNSKFPLPIAI